MRMRTYSETLPRIFAGITKLVRHWPWCIFSEGPRLRKINAQRIERIEGQESVVEIWWQLDDSADWPLVMPSRLKQSDRMMAATTLCWLICSFKPQTATHQSRNCHSHAQGHVPLLGLRWDAGWKRVWMDCPFSCMMCCWNKYSVTVIVTVGKIIVTVTVTVTEDLF